MQRDFTYIDDIVEGVVRTLDRAPQPDPSFDTETPDPAHSWAPYQVLNIGNHGPAACSNTSTRSRKRSVARPSATTADAAGRRAGDVCGHDAAHDWTGHKPGTPIRRASPFRCMGFRGGARRVINRAHVDRRLSGLLLVPSQTLFANYQASKGRVRLNGQVGLRASSDDQSSRCGSRLRGAGSPARFPRDLCYARFRRSMATCEGACA